MTDPLTFSASQVERYLRLLGQQAALDEWKAAVDAEIVAAGYDQAVLWQAALDCRAAAHESQAVRDAIVAAAALDAAPPPPEPPGNDTTGGGDEPQGD